MLNAFLYDFKKKIKENLSWQKLTRFQRRVLVAIGLSMILYLVAAIAGWLWLLVGAAVLLIASLVIVSRKATADKRRMQDDSTGGVSVIQTQTEWFIKKRVDTVKGMLSFQNTHLHPSSCVDLLLVECDNKLRSTRPSELIQKRIKPIAVSIAIIILSLFTAWINIMLPGANIVYEGSLSQHFLSIMKALANDIVLSQRLMVAFVVVCVYATAIYLAIVCIILPAVVCFVDRDFLLIAELKDVLLYIKYEDASSKQEIKCHSQE